MGLHLVGALLNRPKKQGETSGDFTGIFWKGIHSVSELKFIFSGNAVLLFKVRPVLMKFHLMKDMG